MKQKNHILRGLNELLEHEQKREHMDEQNYMRNNTDQTYLEWRVSEAKVNGIIECISIVNSVKEV